MQTKALSAKTEPAVAHSRQAATMSVIGILLLVLGAGVLGHTAKAVPLSPSGKGIVLPAAPNARPATPGTPNLRAKAAPLNRSVTAAYKSAFKFAARKNWSAVRRRTARARHPELEKILRWREMTQSGNGYSFSEIVDFANQNPDWPLPNTLRNRAEEGITETTPPQVVLSWFANRPPQTTDGKIAYGRALIATGRRDEGFLNIRDAWVFGRFNRRDEVLFMRQYKKRFTESDHWARLDNLLWNGRRREARRMLRRVSSGHRALARARIQLRRRRGGVDGAIARVPASLRCTIHLPDRGRTSRHSERGTLRLSHEATQRSAGSSRGNDSPVPLMLLQRPDVA